MKKLMLFLAALLVTGGAIGAQSPVNASQQSSMNGVLNAKTFSGADIGLQINAATASCTASGIPKCKVYVPAGEYPYTNTIVMPQAVTNYQNSYEIDFDPAAILNYNGSGDAILVGGPGNSAPPTNYKIRSPHINITSAATSGIHIERVYGFTLYDPQVVGPDKNHGYGIWYDGSGQGRTENPQIYGVAEGLRFTINGNPSGTPSITYLSPDNNTITGGQIEHAGIGFHEVAGKTPIFSNNVIGTLFAFVDRPVLSEFSANLHFSGCYIEHNSASYPVFELGANGGGADFTVIEGCHIYPDTSTPAIIKQVLGNNLTAFNNNAVINKVVNFFNIGTFSGSVRAWNNSAAGLSGSFVSQDVLNNSFYMGSTQNFPGSVSITNHGFGLNSLTGNAQDLNILCRVGGAKFFNFGSSGAQGNLDCSGNLFLSGNITSGESVQAPIVNATTNYRAAGTPGFSGKCASGTTPTMLMGIVTGCS
jgi:hypothetical protein